MCWPFSAIIFSWSEIAPAEPRRASATGRHLLLVDVGSSRLLQEMEAKSKERLDEMWEGGFPGCMLLLASFGAKREENPSHFKMDKNQGETRHILRWTKLKEKLVTF